MCIFWDKGKIVKEAIVTAKNAGNGKTTTLSQPFLTGTGADFGCFSFQRTMTMLTHPMVSGTVLEQDDAWEQDDA